ncbi:hypothetical protein [Metabacillus sp. 84]|uniref:hypothetical protein n=1 Tax=unclassified Metabacillus TaxID=2675274 RepID=UPI003CF50E66
MITGPESSANDPHERKIFIAHLLLKHCVSHETIQKLTDLPENEMEILIQKHTSN